MVFIAQRKQRDPLSHAALYSYLARYLTGKFEQWKAFPVFDHHSDTEYVKKIEHHIIEHVSKENVMIIQPIKKGEAHKYTWYDLFDQDDFSLYGVEKSAIESASIRANPSKLGFLVPPTLRPWFHQGVAQQGKEVKRIGYQTP